MPNSSHGDKARRALASEEIAGIVENAIRRHVFGKNTRESEDIGGEDSAAEEVSEKILALLADPVAVHVNMLSGAIAKPSINNIIHLYGRDTLLSAPCGDTAPAAPSVEKKPGEPEALTRVLIKRGLYWRRSGLGYSGLLAEAERFTEARAASLADHDPDITSMLASEAPEFAPACWEETKLAMRTAQRDAAESRAVAAEAEVERLLDLAFRVRAHAAQICNEAAAYFERTTGHYDRVQAAGSYRATGALIRAIPVARTDGGSDATA